MYSRFNQAYAAILNEVVKLQTNITTQLTGWKLTQVNLTNPAGQTIELVWQDAQVATANDAAKPADWNLITRT